MHCPMAVADSQSCGMRVGGFTFARSLLLLSLLLLSGKTFASNRY